MTGLSENQGGRERGIDVMEKDSIYDLIIIGAGPAGLSAAIYGMRAGLKTLILEQAAMGGGQVLTTYEVDNYPGLPKINGFDLGTRFEGHAKELGAESIITRVLEVVSDEGQETKIVRTQDGDFLTRTVILATGASHAMLGIPGEKEFVGKGVSYCATCDGAFFRKKEAAVIGGGDVALEDAIYLAGLCEKVYLIHRRNELRAAMSLQEGLKRFPNVEILWEHVVEEICGKDQVSDLRLRHVGNGKERLLPVAGVFIAVGIRPNSELFASLVSLDEQGYVKAGEDCITSAPGIFAAGDIRTKKLRQVVTAAADGANAVASAEHYLRIGKQNY